MTTHIHVNRQDGTDLCATCGRDLRDAIHREVADLIQTCDLNPGKHSINRLLEICDALNMRIDRLERRLDASEKRQHHDYSY
jgi:hypothetical protein